MWGLALASLLVGASDARGGPGPLPAPSPAPSKTTSRSRAPLSGAPLRYGDPVVPAPRPVLARRVEELVLRLARESPPRTPPAPLLAIDARLESALDRLMPLLPAVGAPSGSLREQALWVSGVVEPVPYLLTMLVPVGADEDVEQQLARVLPPVLVQGRYRRVGVSMSTASDGSRRLVLALQESFVELSPVARALPVGGHATLSARALPPYGKPEVFVTAPDGSVTRLHMEGRPDAGGALRTTFICGPRPGAHQVEVAAEDRLGDAVLANFPIYCGVPAPTEVVVADRALAVSPVDRTLGPEKLRAEVEARVLELLNKDRAAAGLPAVTAEPRLASVARGHSTEMRDHHFFGHISPSTGSAVDRLRAASVAVLAVRENLGRASSAVELDRSLMGSPSHRANILASDVDRVGIGVAVGPLDEASGTYDLFLTQLFARLPEPWDPVRVEALLRGRLVNIRRDAHVPVLVVDAELDRVARQVAAQAAATVPGHAGDGSVALGGPDRPAGDDPLDRALPSLSNRFQWVRSLRVRASDVSQFVSSPPLVDGAASHAGVAVALGKGEPGAANPIWLVVLLAARR